MSLLSPTSGLAVLRNRNLAFCLSARFLGTLAVTGLWAVLFPVLSRMDRFPHHEKAKARA